MAHKLEAALKARQWKEAGRKDGATTRWIERKYWRRSCQSLKGISRLPMHRSWAFSFFCQLLRPPVLPFPSSIVYLIWTSTLPFILDVAIPRPGTIMPPALEEDNNTAVSLDTLSEGRLRETLSLPLFLWSPSAPFSLFFLSLPLLFRPPVPVDRGIRHHRALTPRRSFFGLVTRAVSSSLYLAGRRHGGFRDNSRYTRHMGCCP